MDTVGRSDCVRPGSGCRLATDHVLHHERNVMDWKHILVAVLFVVLGYWLGTKFPGYLSKATGGIVSG